MMTALPQNLSRCTPTATCKQSGKCLRANTKDTKGIYPVQDFSLDVHPGKPCWMYIESAKHEKLTS